MDDLKSHDTVLLGSDEPFPVRIVQRFLELPPWRQDGDMLYSLECAQQSYDDNMSSTSEDDSYPKPMDQDKNDVRPEDSDTDTLDAESD